MSVYPKSIFIAALLVLLALSYQASAQEEVQTFMARNALYVEFGGNSGPYSINYSRIIHQKDKLKLNVSSGFSMVPNKVDFQSISNRKWLPVVPLEFSAFWGKSNHHLELGIGITSYLDRGLEMDLETFEVSDKVFFSAFIPLRVGYRYQKPTGGIFYRVAYTPLMQMPISGRDSWEFLPIFAALSIGKSF
ncbi:hypothetical protein [Algoriphagus sp.]|uniref:hypothetical protein n=1 Tax=Algoriphagus sp. TaxID=1872435 RepID=UPI003F6F01E4